MAKPFAGNLENGRTATPERRRVIMFDNGARPKLSVVIPTYNRCELLRQGLEQLARQRVPKDEFEVIVSDDGSSDGTRAMVESFSDRLRLKYCFQEDRGFRAAAARNAGARMAAAPTLVFLDAGAMVGPDYLHHHLTAHSNGRSRRAVAGYAYAYNPDKQLPGLEAALARMPPEAVVPHYGNDPEFVDVRHEALATLDFDLNRSALPWMLFWSMNCSISRADFWEVGGFAEDFHGWGLEDMEFGFRVQRHGLPFHFSREAWVIHAPHDRDRETEVEQLMTNINRFVAKHPVPVIEVGWGVITKYYFPFTWEDEYRRIVTWSDECRDLDVTGEIEEHLHRIPSGERIAVIGVGGSPPRPLPPSIVMDFDRELLDRAVAAGDHVGHHAIGLRTPLADQSVDHVILTSRLAGPQRRWSAEILAEARRIGGRVHTSGGDGAVPASVMADER